MNQKVYSVLFCALLASTFAHELRAKGAAPSVSSRLEVFERAASNQVCQLECSHSGSSFSFGLTIEAIGDTLVIANLSANAALLINATAHIIVLLNGTSGAGVALDLAAQKGVYVKSGLWVAANGSLEAFIQSLSGGLRAIFNISGGVKFNFQSVANAALKVISEIVGKLVANIAADLKADAKLGLQIIIAIGGGIVTLLNGALRGVLALFGAGIIHIAQDIAGFLNVLQGLSVIFGKVTGSLEGLIEAGVSFDLKVIISAANGLEALVNLLLQIGSKIDIGAALGKILNDAESFFKLIAQLGGNVSIGISGVFLVISKIIALINKNVNVEVVISAIIQFVAHSREHITGDLTEALHATFEGFLSVLERINAKSSLKELINIVTKLREGKLTIGGVNISVVIEKLLKGIIVGASNLLEVVAFVVLQLQTVVEVSLLVPYLLLVLICKLNTAAGVAQLIALGIKIHVDFDSIAGGILKNILSGIASLIFNLLTGNFYNALVQLPVIGTIIKAVNVAIESASNGKASLKELLNVSSLIKNLILGLIQMISGIYLGVSTSVISQVKAILETTSSVSATINVNITLSASTSISG